MKIKLLGVILILSTVSNLVYPDQPPVDIDSALTQQMNAFNQISGLVSAENPGVGGGRVPPDDGGSCSGVADCIPGVGSVLNLETFNLINQAVSMLGGVSDETPGVGGPAAPTPSLSPSCLMGQCDPGVGGPIVLPPGTGPSCLVGDCGPGVGRFPLDSDVNTGDMDLVRFVAEELGLMGSELSVSAGEE